MSVERDEKRPEGWVLGPWGFGGWEEMGGGGRQPSHWRGRSGVSRERGPGSQVTVRLHGGGRAVSNVADGSRKMRAGFDLWVCQNGGHDDLGNSF